MTTNEIGYVVDKLSDKIGLAVTKVQPVAEEVVRQVVTRAYVWGVTWLVLLFVFAVTLRASVSQIKEREPYDDTNIAFGFGVALSIAGMLGAVAGMSYAASIIVAPIPSILGM